jgi:hypothetical protein
MCVRVRVRMRMRMHTRMRVGMRVQRCAQMVSDGDCVCAGACVFVWYGCVCLQELELHPDGNSLDMMQGLVYTKR